MLARRLDERGYPQPLPERLRVWLTRAWVAAGAAAACAFLELLVGTHDGLVWWALPFAVVLGLLPGVLAGLLFAARDRELAIPTPAAAGIAAFVIAFVTPFAVYGIYIVLWLIHTGP